MTPSEQGRPNVPHRGLRYQNRTARGLRQIPSIGFNCIAIRKRSDIWSTADCTPPPSSKNSASVMHPAQGAGRMPPPEKVVSPNSAVPRDGLVEPLPLCDLFVPNVKYARYTRDFLRDPLPHSHLLT